MLEQTEGQAGSELNSITVTRVKVIVCFVLISHDGLSLSRILQSDLFA